MMDRHRLPIGAVHPLDAKPGNEIRFPAQIGCRSIRAQKEAEPPCRVE